MRISKPEKPRLYRYADIAPPTALDDEKKLVAALMVNPARLDEVRHLVSVDDFFDPLPQAVFRGIGEFHESGETFCFPALADFLAKKHEVTLIDATKLLGTIGTGADYPYHARQVQTAAALRRVWAIGSQAALQSAKDRDAQPDQIIADTISQLFAVLEGSIAGIPEKPIGELIPEFVDRMRRRKSGEQSERGLETGFTTLDRMLGVGMLPGQLVVVGARPSMGKSSLMLRIALEVAARQELPALFVSLEMSQEQVEDRAYSAESGVPLSDILDGAKSDAADADLARAIDSLRDKPLIVHANQPVQNVALIASAARRVKRRHGALALVVVDYLQLVQPDDKRLPREQQIAELARAFKLLARQLECVVLLGAQLNRQAETQERPRLSHLRESGAIEQDADTVLLLFREGDKGEVIVAKQRSGPTGTAHVEWHGPTASYRDLPQPEPSAELSGWNEGESV